MSDITLKDIKSGFNLSKINDNFQTIEDVINDEIVHGIGGNNIMSQSLDMNSNRLLNLVNAVSDKEPVTLEQAKALSFTVAIDGDTKYVSELAVAKADTKTKLGDIYVTEERTTGNGGEGVWDTVSGQTPNGFRIVPHDSLPFQLKLRLKDGVISVRAMGSDAATINFAQANFDTIDMGDHDYTTTEKVTITTGVNVLSSGARILKNYDGVGMELTNGAATVQFFGNLSVNGTGAFAGTGLIASTSPLAHGINIINSRIRVFGILRGDNHIGNGVNFDATNPGNANKSDFNELRGTSNNGHGIRGEGSNDNQSVWRVGFYSQFNFLSGFSTSSDYSGRQWTGLIYCEGNGKDGSSDEVDILKLRTSKLDIYAEEQGGGNEIVLGANTERLIIRSQRNNLDFDNSTAQTNRWEIGHHAYNPGTAGGPRIGNAGGFRFTRARAATGGEGVKVPLEGATSTYGFLVGKVSDTTPVGNSVGIEDNAGTSSFFVGDEILRATSNSVDFLKKTAIEFEVGSTDASFPTKINMRGNINITSGSGSPEGVVTAAVGSLFLRSDGGANTTLYVKETGAGNTGWVAK